LLYAPHVRLEYGSAATYTCTAGELDKLERVQRASTRLVELRGTNYKGRLQASALQGRSHQREEDPQRFLESTDSPIDDDGDNLGDSDDGGDDHLNYAASASAATDASDAAAAAAADDDENQHGRNSLDLEHSQLKVSTYDDYFSTFSYALL
uniref:DRY_EERY domain-containing protein n=1 Tax=Echinostoma caproni TaxID=27848 RepID=A0A183B015_9TREM